MPTSPSFQSYKMISTEPFRKENCKLYVTVQNPNTGNNRDVRWYSDEEYAKLYGRKEKITDNWDMKHARGFDNGPILVIRCNRPEDEPWLRASAARYAMGIGWYFASTDTLPENIPKNFKYILLSWKEFRDGNDYIAKKPTVLAEIINQKARDKKWVEFR